VKGKSIDLIRCLQIIWPILEEGGAVIIMNEEMRVVALCRFLEEAKLAIKGQRKGYIMIRHFNGSVESLAFDLGPIAVDG
jgi:hypothetical protein